MAVRDFLLAAPTLRTDTRIVGLSTDTKPTIDEDGSELQIGTEFFSDDTSQSWYWAGDGTVTAETPTNMRSDITSACPLRCFSAATADITDPVLGIELARRAVTGDMNGTPANALWGQLDLVYEPMVPGFFVGPAAIYGYWGGTVATPGFAHLDFIAIPSSLITGLS